MRKTSVCNNYEHTDTQRFRVLKCKVNFDRIEGRISSSTIVGAPNITVSINDDMCQQKVLGRSPG